MFESDHGIMSTETFFTEKHIALGDIGDCTVCTEAQHGEVKIDNIVP